MRRKPQARLAIDCEDPASIAAAQETREPLAAQRAQRKCLEAERKANPRVVERLFRKAEAARNEGRKLELAHQAASEWAKSFERLAACRRGCSQCCHLPVTITATEARRLARYSGRAMQEPIPAKARSGTGIEDDIQVFVQTSSDARAVGSIPCPFLKNGLCSAYPVRPFACRTHLNLDDDPLLCRVVPDREAKVPYADSRALWYRFLMLTPTVQMADIRWFFPKGAPAKLESGQ